MKMSRSMRIVCSIAALLAVYIFFQTAATLIDLVMVRGNLNECHFDWVLFISSIITSVIIICLVWWRGDLWNIRSIKWKWSPLMLFITMLGMMGTDILNELLNVGNLDMMEQMFGNLSSTTIGMLAIALLGPICEEVLFRGGIEGVMLKHGVRPWIAIVVSAFLFGAIHMNPGQLLPAALGGAMFGILYWKTRSIIPGIICHVVNNSLSVWAMRSEEFNEQDTFTSLFGSWWVTLVAFIIITILVAWVYKIYIKSRPTLVLAAEETEVEISAEEETEVLEENNEDSQL